MLITKKTIIKELETELAMRDKVWAKNGGFFVNRQHQNRYDTLKMVIAIFEKMTERDVQGHIVDVELAKMAVQTKLF